MIRLTPPTVEKLVSSGWGQSRAYRGGWHAGLDFPSKLGSPVRASAPGVVSKVQNQDTSNAGLYVVIDHGGIFTRYLHNNANHVSVGQRVSRGERIADVGTTGHSAGPHVHFDTKLLLSNLATYKQKYGEPTTGFAKSMSVGMGQRATGVPSETFMDGAIYKPSVIENSTKRGVVFYTGISLSTVALMVFVGWGIYKLTR
jgi:murein DD-endopeptidase MepM/ murein hydrolase activator NlpD